MHHHHFFHGIHQLNVNSGYDQNFNQSLTMVPQSSFPTFTPNPSINFPSAVDENVSQHPNLNHTNKEYLILGYLCLSQKFLNYQIDKKFEFEFLSDNKLCYL